MGRLGSQLLGASQDLNPALFRGYYDNHNEEKPPLPCFARTSTLLAALAFLPFRQNGDTCVVNIKCSVGCVQS